MDIRYPEGIWLFLFNFVIYPLDRTLILVYSAYLNLFLDAFAGEIGHSRSKKAKGLSSSCQFMSQSCKSFKGQGTSRAPHTSRARQAASKKPVVEQSESKDNYDSQEDETYVSDGGQGDDDNQLCDEVEIQGGDEDAENLAVDDWHKPDYWAYRNESPYI